MNLETLINEVKRDMDIANIPYKKDIPFYINNRTTRTLGACFYEYRNSIKVATKIEISRKFLEECQEQDIKDTICHELIHSACPRAGHRGTWKAYARKMNEVMPQYNIFRTTSPKTKNGEKYMSKKNTNENYKYTIICNTCHNVFKYKRLNKVVKIIRGDLKGGCTCPYCGDHDFRII